jgi:diguanylate cyclase (GGDEF)-like protein
MAMQELADAGTLAPDGEEARHISASVTWNIVNLVRRQEGEDGVARLVALAGEGRTAAQLQDDGTWSSYTQGRALFEAAAEVLGDSHALRHVGEAIARADMTSEVAALLRSLGSPGELLRQISQVVPKFCTVVRMEPVEVAEDHALISATTVEGYPRYDLLCDFTAGLLSQATIPFDLPPATVSEEQCELLGDERCLFRVVWRADSEHPLSAEGPSSEAELAILAGRLETFQATAADLVSTDNVDEVLARITNRAGLAVRAPRHLLVVRLYSDAEPKIHHVGLTGSEPTTLAAELLAEAVDDHGGSRLIVDIASARRHYGRLAAIYDEGITFFPAEQVQLAAYARLAAAALDAATALEDSRREAATARALFTLARALANVGTQVEIAERIIAAIPDMVECDSSTVSLWSPESQTMELAAAVGTDPEGEALLRVPARPSDTPRLTEMLVEMKPQFLESATSDAFLAERMRAGGMTAAVVVPITAGGELLGIVTAAVRDDAERLRADPDLLERLTGLADLAATALQNARLVERIRHQALYDSITGLPNKRLLEDRIVRALSESKRTGDGFTLFFLDLDRFKNVNDTLGHAVGDQLLRQVAMRLTSSMREEDTIARLGGDEFALVIPRVMNSDVARVVADKLYAALQEPFCVGEQRLFITSSIGIAIAPIDGDNYESLLKHADIAMYRAKQQGRNRYATYSPTLQEDLSHRLRLENDLHGAHMRDEMRLFFQPQVDLATGRVVGVEALIRWDHPELGLIEPDLFISLAEESGLIVEIDAWVIDHACRQARHWLDAGVGPLRMAINLATRDLHDPGLPDVVAEALGRSRLDAAQLEVEITERVVGTGTDQVLEALIALKGLGVRLAIDDFGTGSSGLSRLRSCPIDTLKIDKSFVHEVTEARPEVPLLAAMVSLAHDLGLDVVAEGVETRAQATFLRTQRCDLAQGYLFAVPQSATDLEHSLRQ